MHFIMRVSVYRALKKKHATNATNIPKKIYRVGIQTKSLEKVWYCAQTHTHTHTHTERETEREREKLQIN